jgi:hypothetical protein
MDEQELAIQIWEREWELVMAYIEKEGGIYKYRYRHFIEFCILFLDL